MEWFDGVFSAALSASARLINFLMLSKTVRPEMPGLENTSGNIMKDFLGDQNYIL